MTAQELIDATIGERGLMAYEALMDVLRKNPTNTIDETMELMSAGNSMANTDKITITFTKDQWRTLSAYMFFGIDVTEAIMKLIKKELHAL